MKKMIVILLASVFFAGIYPLYGEENDSVPDWVKTVTLKGDFRLRYQWQEEDSVRGRVRIRMRAGILAEPTEGVKVGFGLASGSDDPRSTNVTLDSFFSSKGIMLNYAYGEFDRIKGLTLWGGKYAGIKKAIWLVSDLLWDSDITPEGIGAKGKISLGNITLCGNSGVLILDENKEGPDPYLTYIQPVARFKTDKLSVKGGVAMYLFTHLKGYQIEGYSGPNTNENGRLLNNYNAMSPSLEIKLTNVVPLIPLFEVFGEYVMNMSVDEDNQGFLAGMKMGTSKISGWKDWQIKYMYRRLEREAWLSLFPDSDAYEGNTGVEGHEIVGKLGLMKKISLGVDFYYMKELEGDGEEKVLQIDLVWKF